jgi:hypothetical protein
VKEGHQDIRHPDRDPVGRRGGGSRQGDDEPGDGRLSDEPQADRGERDAHLAHGKILVHVRLDVLNEPGAGVSLVHERLDPGGPHLDGGEFRQDEKRVQEEEERGQEQVEGDRHGTFLLDRGPNGEIPFIDPGRRRG